MPLRMRHSILVLLKISLFIDPCLGSFRTFQGQDVASKITPGAQLKQRFGELYFFPRGGSFAGNPDNNEEYRPPTGSTPYRSTHHQEQMDPNLATDGFEQAQPQAQWQQQQGGVNARNKDMREVVLHKFMQAIGPSSMTILFVCLVWRSIHNYELACQIPSGTMRILCVVPTVLLFLFNVAGCIMCFFRASQKSKMKAILNMNGLSEMVLLVYNIVNMMKGSNMWTPREVYVGRVLVNFWFLTLWFSFAKARWITDGNLPLKPQASTQYQSQSLHQQSNQASP